MIELNSFLNQIRMTNRVINGPINTILIMEALTGLEPKKIMNFNGCCWNLVRNIFNSFRISVDDIISQKSLSLFLIVTLTFKTKCILIFWIGLLEIEFLIENRLHMQYFICMSTLYRVSHIVQNM